MNRAKQPSGTRAQALIGVLLGMACLANSGCGPSAAAEKEAIQKLKDLGAVVVVIDGHATAVNLLNVELKGNSLDDAMPWVAKLGYLQSLNAASSKINDSHLVAVGKVRTIGDLNLQETPVTDAGVAHLANLNRVETLYLTGTPITGAALEAVAKMSALRTLGLGQTKTKDGYKYLKTHALLQRLLVSDVELSDDDADAIASIPQLGQLDMNGATMSDAGRVKVRAKVKIVNE